MARSVYRIGFDSDRLIKCNAWNNIQLLSLLTHKSQCWLGLCTGLVIWVQVNQSLPVNNCRQAMITSSHWLHVASDLASNHPAFAMYHMSSRKTVGNITIGCLSLREQTCVNNTRATLTFTPYRYCSTGNPLLATTSHVGIREFNCGIILTSGTSVRHDPYPVTEGEAEITCPTFSDVISCATQAETFTELECTMTAECTHIVAWVTRYCQSWRLKPSTSKTVSSVFHLQNTYANRQLSVIMNGETLKHDPYPVTEAEAEITCSTFSDNIGCATQAETFTELECTMTAECINTVAGVTLYCQSWRLKPSTSKTISSVFLLQNTCANCQLSQPECHHEWRNVKASSLSCTPRCYPGPHFDIWRAYVENCCQVQEPELLSKVSGTSWGTNAKTLCTLTLDLCCSVAEYCCPAWLRSSHKASIDCQLNNTMHMNSGCVWRTQIP